MDGKTFPSVLFEAGMSWLSVLVLRNSAKQLAVMGKIYKGKRKPFPKLKSATTIIGFKF